MTDDVVAELDEWLEREATTLHHYPNDDTDTGLLQRARAEIVALRASLERHDRLVIQAVVVATPSIRDDALEEAARVCEGGYTTGSTASTLKAIAAAIRALKERRDE